MAICTYRTDSNRTSPSSQPIMIDSEPSPTFWAFTLVTARLASVFSKAGRGRSFLSLPCRPILYSRSATIFLSNSLSIFETDAVHDSLLAHSCLI